MIHDRGARAREFFPKMVADPTTAFLYATLAMGRRAIGAPVADRGARGLAGVLELVPRLENAATLRLNGRATATEVRHVAARVAAACLLLVAEGDERCGLPPLLDLDEVAVDEILNPVTNPALRDVLDVLAVADVVASGSPS